MKFIKTNCLLLLLVSCVGCALLPSNSQNTKIKEINKLKQVGLGCLLFAVDNRSMLPKKLEQIRIYMGKDFDYSYVKLITKNIRISDINDPDTRILAVSTNPMQGAMQAVVYVDGHCEVKAKEEIAKYLGE